MRSKKSRLLKMTAASFLLAFSLPALAVNLNEIRIDQPGSDNDEYFELKGTPGESLDGLSYVVIGDGTGGSGVIEAVIDLSGQVLSADGQFVAAEGTFSLGTADLTSNLNFENSDNVTHLLVSGFTGANGDDLDTNDDGVLDITPWTAVIDSIALVETIGSGEQVYLDDQVGPDGTFVPGHVYYCAANGWQIGGFNLDENTDSPGLTNTLCPEPELRINEVRIDQPSSDNDEYFELQGAADQSLDGLSYIVIGDGTTGSGTIESVTDLAGQTIPANGLFVAAESTFTAGVANLITNLNFENSDNVTHLLVSGFTGMNGDDLDTNDDGVLDSTPWTEVIDSIALVETVGSGDQVYLDNRIGPDGTFVPGHIYYCDTGWQIGTFSPVGETDTAGAENICDIVPPSVQQLEIYEIQGNGDASPVDGEEVITSGVVSSDLVDTRRGFYIQSITGDNDPLTSDGIFVFDPDADVANGDLVEVTGFVDEFFGLTEITNVSAINILSSGNSIEPTAVSLPETSNGELERYEGMLIEIVSPMIVAQNFFLGRYGQLSLASADDNGDMGRLLKPTDIYPAGTPEALALQDENNRRLLILDDGLDLSSFGDNPNPVPYLGAPFEYDVLRGGDQVSNLIGVLDWGRISSAQGADTVNDYRLQPTVEPVFTPVNLRQDAPDAIDGRLKVASFNVLNYFTTIDTGSNICGPAADQGCRGADTDSEFERQKAKIVKAVAALDADVIGLIEIENNGSGPLSALQDLTAAVNSFLGEQRYAVIMPPMDTLGTDVITVAAIYDVNTVTPLGAAQTLNTGAFDPNLPDGLSRQPLLQTFTENFSGEAFTIIVNHLKSKRPPSEVQGDGNDDQGDGQGAWNLRRTQAAQELVSWVNTLGLERTMIIGDLNSYAQEDPILALEAAGYVNPAPLFDADTYSYTFDAEVGTLDYGLVSGDLLEYVTGTTVWHINTDEPAVIGYDENFNPQGYYQDNVFRASDHDPVIVALTLPNVDRDQDGVLNEVDRCDDTLAEPNEFGCSDIQIENLLQQLTAPYDDAPFRWRVFIRKLAIIHLYYEGYIGYEQTIELLRSARQDVRDMA